MTNYAAQNSLNWLTRQVPTLRNLDVTQVFDSMAYPKMPAYTKVLLSAVALTKSTGEAKIF